KGTNCTKTLTFPGVIQSNPPNSSPIQTVTLKNVGNVPLTLQNRFIGFTNDFLVANLATNNCTAGQVLAPNSNCDIGVTFNPSLTRITGPRSDLLRVFTNSNDIGNSEIDITFAPNGTTAGLRTDVLDVIDFNNNVVSSIQQISVSGVATGGTTTLSLAVSPLTGLNFGNQTINTISGPQTVTVTNNNTVNMNIGVGA